MPHPIGRPADPIKNQEGKVRGLAALLAMSWILVAQAIGVLGVALTFGLALLAMVYVVGLVSGCHVNPAVTLGLLLGRKIAARSAVSYVVAQVAGAILAAALIWLIAQDALGGCNPGMEGFGANGYAAHSPGGYGLLAALAVENALLAELVLTVLGATHRAAPVGFTGLAIGLVPALIHLVSIPVTNTSVNPARSIGPAVFVGDWALRQLWVFVMAPLAGAVIAAAIYRFTHGREETISAAEAEQALPGQQAERSDAHR